MRFCARWLLWFSVGLLPWSVNAAPPVDLETALKSIPAYAPDRVLVRFKPGTAAASVADLHRQASGQRLKTIPGIGVEVIKIPRGRLQQTLQRYRANPQRRICRTRLPPHTGAAHRRC
jgi:hypothetical protein